MGPSSGKIIRNSLARILARELSGEPSCVVFRGFSSPQPGFGYYSLLPFWPRRPRTRCGFVSDKADLVVKVDNPRKLIESLTALDAFKQAEKLDAVRQFLDAPQARRFFEFIAYYERDFGAKWPELLDRLAGGGMALSAKIKDGNDDPVLLAVQATDEALLVKFVDLAVAAIQQEMGRTESKEKLTKEKHRDFETLRFGNGLHVCRLGSAAAP